MDLNIIVVHSHSAPIDDTNVCILSIDAGHLPGEVERSGSVVSALWSEAHHFTCMIFAAFWVYLHRVGCVYTVCVLLCVFEGGK